MPTASFSHTLRVRWSEVDPQGIVFNGHYLTYFDIGITEFWRAIGLPYPAGLVGADSDLFVVRSLINYHAPARFDDLVEIKVRVARLGNSSMTFELNIDRADEKLVSGELVYVNADPVKRKALPLPMSLRNALKPWEPKLA